MIKSALWMVGTLTSFSLMAVGVRELSGLIDTFQILFFRSVIGLVIISLAIACSGKGERFRTHRLGLHGIRNSIHFAGSYGWFLGIGLLPLAEVFALEFTVPLWTALIASTFLNEQLTLRKVTAIALGLIGVFVIVQPGQGVVNFSSFIVLGAAICYAIAHSSTKSLSATEHPLTILFFMCLVQLPIGLCFSLQNWQNPAGIQWFWVVVIGITLLTAHFCMAKAMQTAKATVVVTMDFLRLPAIAMVGVLFYSEPLEFTLMAGALLMLLGNLLNIYVPENKHQEAIGKSN